MDFFVYSSNGVFKDISEQMKSNKDVWGVRNSVDLYNKIPLYSFTVHDASYDGKYHYLSETYKTWISWEVNPPQPEPEPPRPEPPKEPDEPKEPPKYHHYQARKFYFQNQLVATFSNLLSTVAELEEDGTINWKSTPDLRLLRNGQKEGKIIHLRPTTINNWELAVVRKEWNYLDFYRLKSVAKFQRPKEKPYTETDKEVILTAKDWEGTQLLTQRKRLQLNNLLSNVSSQEDIKERITGLHALFS